ncbi:sensor histidine kinase [Rubellimicrobium sp. CFH 75288]|uniref:sensor histidine kinase n=1 Tax=Rubellimicrobium sp. CFH 75288 TaxID=2697034 RepID=UPI00141275DF|nr:sensor histidine kinase [Rubellimicrobium sp. CFH 75288]NAZ37940.1 histidine kinase [Rubellimicrobium sp. CFH 75288]
MTALPRPGLPKVDVRDLRSVRRAVRAVAPANRDASPPASEEGTIIGADGVAPEAQTASRRNFVTLQASPLARKIITFNLVGLILLVTGMLWLTPSRDNLAFQRASGLASEAILVADVVAAHLPPGPPVSLAAGDGFDPQAVFDRLGLRGGTRAFLFDRSGALVAQAEPRADLDAIGPQREVDGTLITNALNALWEGLASALGPARPASPDPGTASLEGAHSLVERAFRAGTVVETGTDAQGRTVFTVAHPVRHEGEVVGVVAVRSAGGEIDSLVRREREQVLRMFVVGVLVSIGLSLVLARTIANPLSDLAAAAEVGRERSPGAMSPGRVRIPDLSARPDEIGRLSAALRGMVAALYDRIEANEQFAADVAHEIKNPLASLRSAVGTLHLATREDQRRKLLEIIEHDVRRLDRLVSDISNASRLDSELVKEEERPFDLLRLIGNLNEHLGAEARAKGIEFIADLPPQPIVIHGLENRLAQVFVNLLSNAISFCEEGDAIRIWARRRENRVLVVVEDTGPGIPEGSLEKIFQRFYSERPEGQFGNNSGLGLAISKQIVEAHGGVIWAENIRPTEADPTSEPLGARFVVGLPI